MDVIIKLTDNGKALFDAWNIDPQVWIQHAVDDKVRRLADRAVIEHTAYNPKKLTESEKETQITTICTVGKLAPGSMRQDVMISGIPSVK